MLNELLKIDETIAEWLDKKAKELEALTEQDKSIMARSAWLALLFLSPFLIGILLLIKAVQ